MIKSKKVSLTFQKRMLYSIKIMLKDVYVVFIKWGSIYKAEDVNKMVNMIRKNTTYKVHFYCFTEDSRNILPEVNVKALPEVNVHRDQLPYAYRKEVGLCRDDLGGLTGKRVLFFDLDQVIIGNLDEFFDLPKKDEFYIIKDWNQKDGTVGNASIYSWVVGTLGFIVSDFEKEPDFYYKKYFTASQECLSAKVIEKYKRLNFWPKKWTVSFKADLLPIWPLRLFISPKKPNQDVKVLVFHGQPKIEDAISGNWQLEKDKSRWKKIYKSLLPSPWIKRYIDI